MSLLMQLGKTAPPFGGKSEFLGGVPPRIENNFSGKTGKRKKANREDDRGGVDKGTINLSSGYTKNLRKKVGGEGTKKKEKKSCPTRKKLRKYRKRGPVVKQDEIGKVGV